jgi:YidC/Oxa1 family membrane protein insertase
MGSSFVTQRTNSYTRDKNATMDASTKQMLILMPLMYLWFGFIMPAAMCIYMMTNAIISMLQEMLAARMLRGKYQEMQAKREEEERLEKEAEKRRKAEKIAKRQQEEAEAKERRKKAAAIAAAGGSAVKKESAAVKKDSANNKGAVGIRKYARGRDYDPDRFGGVTPYKDPSEVDEAAIEAALAKKKSGKKMRCNAT